jgi:hypothetical protein
VIRKTSPQNGTRSVSNISPSPATRKKRGSWAGLVKHFCMLKEFIFNELSDTI